MSDVVLPPQGLIGNGISRSSAPRLHLLAGVQCGLEITYDLIDLADRDPAVFEETLLRCGTEGCWGVNVTYPFKERAAKVVSIASPVVQEIAWVNTVLFAGSKRGAGHNTDHSGLLRAYRGRFPDRLPGIVGQVGTGGGVGKPVAFGLGPVGRARDPPLRHRLRQGCGAGHSSQPRHSSA